MFPSTNMLNNCNMNEMGATILAHFLSLKGKKLGL
jgi:hypothetical protein